MRTFKLLLHKVFKREKTDSDRMERNRIRNAIETMAQTYLTDYDSVLLFEVLPECLDNALIVVEEEALRERYDIFQESETLFKIQLHDLGLF